MAGEKKSYTDRSGAAPFFYCAGTLFLLFLLFLLFDLIPPFYIQGKNAGYITLVYFTSVFKCLAFSSMAIFFLIYAKKGLRTAANRFIYIWAAGVTGFIMSEFVPAVYISLRIQATELVTARQMEENALFLVLDVVLMLVCAGSYLMTKKDFFIWLGLLDFVVCGACALLLPQPPVDITSVEGITIDDFIYSALYHIAYIVISVNLFAVGMHCRKNFQRIVTG